MKSIGVAAVLCTVAGMSAAQDSVIWENDVEGWRVAIDRTIDNSCFIIAGFDDHQFLRLQFNAVQSNLQLILASSDWNSLQSGQDYDVRLAFGDLEAWSGSAQAHRWKNVLPSLVLNVPFADQQAATFMEEFTLTGTVSLSYNGAEILNLPLAGAEAAVASMVECQTTMSQASDSSAPAADPFAASADQI